MDALILYMVIINSAVAAIAIVIAVAQQRFHRRVEEKLSKAIKDAEVNLKQDVTAIRTQTQEHIEQRMWQMEKRFYEKIEDPKTYGAFIKTLSDHIHSRFMHESKGIKKRIDDFKGEIKQVAAGGGDLSDLATFDWDEDRGLIGNLMKNAALLKRSQRGPGAPDIGASEEPSGPPPWWDEEDAAAYDEAVLKAGQRMHEEFILERERLHNERNKVNIDP